MMQSRVRVPCGLQGTMRGPSPVCSACCTSLLARIKPVTGFAGMSWSVSALPRVTPGLGPMLLSVPTPLVVPAGVMQDAGMACWDRLCLGSGVQRALLSARPQLGRC